MHPQSSRHQTRRALSTLPTAALDFPHSLITIQAGADIDAADSLGRRALHIAALSAHKACLLALLENGAAVDAQDGGGSTALAAAAFQVRWSGSGAGCHAAAG